MAAVQARIQHRSEQLEEMVALKHHRNMVTRKPPSERNM